jgi:hypothetical protein
MSKSILKFMQLWLWANVKMGRRGCAFAGKAMWCWAEGETNIVVMKPDMAFVIARTWAYLLVADCSLSAVHSSG